MDSTNRPVSEVVQDIIRNIQDIVRSEVRLAKTELGEEVGKAKSAGLLVGVGALTGIFGLFFLLFSIVYALSNLVPNWAAALIVALALALSAGIMLSTGVKRFKQVRATPEKTIESVKENVEWAKQQTK